MTQSPPNKVRTGKAVVAIAGLVFTAASVITGLAAVKWWPFNTEHPAPPQRFTASATFDSVTLTWEPSSDNAKLKEYQLFRDGQIIHAAMLFTWTDHAVEAGHRYVYQIAAVTEDDTSSSKVTAAVQVLYRSDNLGPPIGLTAAEVTGRSVRLVWTPAPGRPSGPFSILRDGSKIGESDAASYADETVTPGSTYAQCHVDYFDHAARGVRVWIRMVAGPLWRMLAGSPGFLTR